MQVDDVVGDKCWVGIAIVQGRPAHVWPRHFNLSTVFHDRIKAIARIDFGDFNRIKRMDNREIGKLAKFFFIFCISRGATPTVAAIIGK